MSKYPGHQRDALLHATELRFHLNILQVDNKDSSTTEAKLLGALSDWINEQHQQTQQS